MRGTRLILVVDLTFRVASFPCEVTFVVDDVGSVRELRVRGKELESGIVDFLFTRQSS